MAQNTVRDGNSPPTARDGTVDDARPTVRDAGEGIGAAPHIHVRLPASLAARFRVQRQFPTMGAEADMLLADDPGTSRQVVLKLYRPGIRPKTEVLEKIASAAPEHVVRLYDYGQADDVWFEVLEYAAHGSLRDFLRGAVPPPKAHAILDELQQALVHLHARHIIHRDLKPENILVRSVFPLDLILSDFGIASVSEHSQRLTSASRTIRYAAPEAASGLITLKVDYWSLGMILVEALNGRHPFEAMSDAVIMNWLTTRPVDVSGVKDAAWNTLCRGLLHRDPRKRWGAEEVRSWLDGVRPAVAADEQPPPGLAAPSEVTAVRPYSIGGKQCRTVVELGEALAQHWEEGVKHLSRNLILAWARDDLRDQSLASYLIDLANEQNLTPDERLLRFIVRIAPQLPPVYKGQSLAREDLLALARQAMQGNSGARDFLWEVYDWNVLGCFADGSVRGLGDAWREAMQLYESLAQQLSAMGKNEPAPDLKACLPAILLARMERAFREALTNDPATQEQLYRFVCAVDVDLPRVYKGRSLSAKNLIALARQAIEGNTDARDFLWELYQRDVPACFADESLQACRQGWYEAVARYEENWSKILASGTPGKTRPKLTEQLPALLLFVFIDQVEPDVVTLLSKLKDSKGIESQTRLCKADELIGELSSWHPQDSTIVAAGFQRCKDDLSSAHHHHSLQTYVGFLYAISLAESVIGCVPTLQSNRIDELRKKVAELVSRATLPKSREYSTGLQEAIEEVNAVLSEISVQLNQISYESFTAALSRAQAAEVLARAAEESRREQEAAEALQKKRNAWSVKFAGTGAFIGAEVGMIVGFGSCIMQQCASPACDGYPGIGLLVGAAAGAILGALAGQMKS